MIYSSADNALERYLELRSELTQVRGQDVSFGSGWSDHCTRTKCRQGKSERVEREDGSSYCSRCGDPWPFRPAGVAARMGNGHREPRGRVDDWDRREARRGREAHPSGGRPPGSGVGAAQQLHGRLAEVSLLGVVLNAAPGLGRGDPAAIWRMGRDAWERTLRVWCCYLAPNDEQRHAARDVYVRGWTYDHVAVAMRPDLLRLGERSTPQAASEIVRVAREAIEARLAARGLLLRTMSARDLIAELGGD